MIWGYHYLWKHPFMSVEKLRITFCRLKIPPLKNFDFALPFSIFFQQHHPSSPWNHPPQKKADIAGFFYAHHDGPVRHAAILIHLRGIQGTTASCVEGSLPRARVFSPGGETPGGRKWGPATIAIK